MLDDVREELVIGILGMPDNAGARRLLDYMSAEHLEMQSSRRPHQIDAHRLRNIQSSGYLRL